MGEVEELLKARWRRCGGLGEEAVRGGLSRCRPLQRARVQPRWQE